MKLLYFICEPPFVNTVLTATNRKKTKGVNNKKRKRKE